MREISSTPEWHDSPDYSPTILFEADVWASGGVAELAQLNSGELLPREPVPPPARLNLEQFEGQEPQTPQEIMLAAALLDHVIGEPFRGSDAAYAMQVSNARTIETTHYPELNNPDQYALLFRRFETPERKPRSLAVTESENTGEEWRKTTHQYFRDESTAHNPARRLSYDLSALEARLPKPGEVSTEIAEQAFHDGTRDFLAPSEPKPPLVSVAEIAHIYELSRQAELSVLSYAQLANLSLTRHNSFGAPPAESRKGAEIFTGYLEAQAQRPIHFQVTDPERGTLDVQAGKIIDGEAYETPAVKIVRLFPPDEQDINRFMSLPWNPEAGSPVTKFVSLVYAVHQDAIEGVISDRSLRTTLAAGLLDAEQRVVATLPSSVAEAGISEAYNLKYFLRKPVIRILKQ